MDFYLGTLRPKAWERGCTINSIWNVVDVRRLCIRCGAFFDYCSAHSVLARQKFLSASWPLHIFHHVIAKKRMNFIMALSQSFHAKVDIPFNGHR